MAVLGVAVACGVAACGGSATKPKPTQYQVVSSRRNQLIPLVAQCFIDRHLLAAADLSVNVSPPDPVSRWLRGGRVVRNTGFDTWYRVKGAGLVVDGKTIDDWVQDAAYDPADWPGMCGPRPHVTPAAPAYQIPGS